MSDEVLQAGVEASAVHPDRDYTPEERAHLGLPPIQTDTEEEA